MIFKKQGPRHQLETGQLVFSIAGRDHGKYYFVYEICPDGRRVGLVNGVNRSSTCLKLKNACHLQKTNVVCQELKLKAENKSPVTTGEVKKYLVELAIDQ